MPSVDEIKLDVAEIKGLANSCKRPNVRMLLLSEIKQLENQISALTENSEVTSSQSSVKTPVSSSLSSAIPLNKITTYAYDQSDKFLKIYVTISGVENASNEQVTCQFLPKSLDLIVRDVQGKNHQLIIQGLLHDIDPSSSSFKLKKDTVLLMLKKVASKTWESVTEHEQRVKDKKSVGKNEPKKEEDPNASLMTMMQQMYNEGDDEMKRTIKKAWCESQDKKGGGMGGLMDDMPMPM